MRHARLCVIGSVVLIVSHYRYRGSCSVLRPIFGQWLFCPDVVEKVENRGVSYFRFRSEILKTAARITRPDSQALQGRDNRKLATPSAKISKTVSMKREFLDSRQMGSFSTEYPLSCRSDWPSLMIALGQHRTCALLFWVAAKSARPPRQSVFQSHCAIAEYPAYLWYYLHVLIRSPARDHATV